MANWLTLSPEEKKRIRNEALVRRMQGGYGGTSVYAKGFPSGFHPEWERGSGRMAFQPMFTGIGSVKPTTAVPSDYVPDTRSLRDVPMPDTSVPDAAVTSPIPPLDESYNVTGGDVQADVASQINQQLYQKALSDDAWNTESKRIIDSDNRLALAVGLWTDTAPDLIKQPGGARTSAASTKSAADLEKVMLTNEWLKNPPHTKDQVAKFATDNNASPVGWAYIKNTLAPLFDYGDMAVWKKLMEDGTVDYQYARKHDTQRNELLRGQNYRAGSVEDDRKAQAQKNFADASRLLSDHLKGRPLTQTLLDEFMSKNPALLLDTDKIAAIEKIASLSDLKPTYITYQVTKAHKGRSVGQRFTAKEGAKDHETGVLYSENPDLIKLSDSDAFDIDMEVIHDQEINDAVAAVRTQLERGDLARDEGQIKIRLSEILGDRSIANPLFTYDPEKDDALAFSQMGVAADREASEDLIRRSVTTKFSEGDGQSALKAHAADLVAKSRNVSDPFLKEMNDLIDSMFKEEPLAPVIETEESGVFPIKLPDGTYDEVPATVKGHRYRIGDSRTGAMDVTPVAETDEYRILPQVKQEVAADGTVTLHPIVGEWVQKYKVDHMLKEQKQIGDTVGALIKKPTEYWSAYNAYNQVYDALEQGLSKGDEDGWALIDQRIVTLAIKLVDTSMVTQSEFDSFASFAGITDQIKHQLREWKTGEPLTAGQKRAVLRMTETWFNQKQKQIKLVAEEHKRSLEKRYPVGDDSNVVLPRGYGIEDLFNVAGASFALMNSSAPSSEALINKFPVFFGLETAGKKNGKTFDVKSELDKLEAESDVYKVPTDRKRTFRGRN